MEEREERRAVRPRRVAPRRQRCKRWFRKGEFLKRCKRIS
jgi:hypothetical protein